MDEAFLAFHRVLSFAGIPIFAKQNWDSNRWLVHQTFNFIIGVLCLVFTTGFVVANVSNFLLCIQGACIWTTGVIMTITLGVCLIFRKEFRIFLEEMAFRDHMLEMPLIDHILLMSPRGEKIQELRNLVIGSQEKLFKYTTILLRSYIACVFLCATLYLCSPVYRMVMTEDESLRILAFDMWFPWSLEDYTVYIISFIFHAYAGYLCCIVVSPIPRPNIITTAEKCIHKRILPFRRPCWTHNLYYPKEVLQFIVTITGWLTHVIVGTNYVTYPGLQSTIILLLGQLIRQTRILTFILLNMNELVLEVTGVQDNRWQAICTLVLSQCVDHYVKIKRFSNRLNVICRPFYLTLILVAIMLVCMCSVKIAVSNKLSLDTMKYYIHEFCFIMVVLVFCLIGQQVENECEALERAVTEKWYIFNHNHKSDIRIFKMALGQRMPIYIFGTITLSLPTFTWFIKTGMSFFTLVMSVLEEET